MSLQEWLQRALREGWAMAHFNISNLEMLRGIVAVCQKLGSPVLIGTSEGEADFVGLLQARALIDAYKQETGLPIFLNADHVHSVERAKAAVDAGYDSVLIDLSKQSYEENVTGAKIVVEYARKKSVDVEAELGYLVTDSSKVYTESFIIPPESLTKPEEAEHFVRETGCDRFSPAVGELHGIAANTPQLDMERIANIRKRLPDSVAMVLHGGSGIPDEQMREAIRLGFNNVHVSTELRVAYTDALRAALKKYPQETAPYKYAADAVLAVQQKIEEKMKLFGSVNRI